jgi:CRP-like cAMP-binding protein
MLSHRPSTYARPPFLSGVSLATRNRLLAALPESEFAQLAPRLRREPLELRHVVSEYDQPPERIYFPETCIISIVAPLSDGSAVETATVGNDGFVGIPVFLGGDRMAAQAFCQVPGETLSLSVDEFRQALARGGRLPVLLGRYTQAMYTQTAQSSACNRIHGIRERCARWLLMTQDRVGANEFPLTQMVLAQMLGVRRATVTEAAGALQRAGHIVYAYGRITVRDRHGLESAACECYRIIRRETDRLLEGTALPDPLQGVRLSEGGMSTLGDASGEQPSRDDLTAR